MTWKIGLIVLLLGVVLTLGGCFSVGTAVSQAAGARQVANLEIEPGSDRTRMVQVDPEQPARLRFEATLTLPQELIDGAEEGSRIVELSAPLNYRVIETRGELLHAGAGELSTTVILPLPGDERVVTLTHESAAFPTPWSGRLHVEAELAEQDDRGIAIESARLRVFDQTGQPARWALGGAASMLLGPMLALAGFFIWVVGLLIRPRRPKVTA